MFLYFSLIISTIYSVPAGAKVGARCFAYMLSHSLFSRKVFHLYWKAEYLLIPRNWQSGFKLRALLFLPHHEPNGNPFLLFSPPTPKWHQFLYHLLAMTSELFSTRQTVFSKKSWSSAIYCPSLWPLSEGP